MKIDVNGYSLDYRLEGPASAPVVTFSHSLMAAKDMWLAQAASLGDRYRILNYDLRGHGASGAPEPPYSLEDLASDVVGLLDALDIERTHFVGLSIGGMIGQVMGIDHADRLESLVLANTISEVPAEMAPMWDERVKTATEQGVAALAEPTLERWFTAHFREQHPDKVALIRAMIGATSLKGFAGCCAAIKALDKTETLTRIGTPTLIIAGTHDLGTPPAASRVIADKIAGSRLEILNAAHLSNIEQEAPFTEALSAFLGEQSA